MRSSKCLSVYFFLLDRHLRRTPLQTLRLLPGPHFEYKQDLPTGYKPKSEWVCRKLVWDVCTQSGPAHRPACPDTHTAGCLDFIQLETTANSLAQRWCFSWVAAPTPKCQLFAFSPDKQAVTTSLPPPTSAMAGRCWNPSCTLSSLLSVRCDFTNVFLEPHLFIVFLRGAYGPELE